MGRGLERIRAWLTPQRRFWSGMALFTVTVIVPVVSPGTSVSWLIGPAAVLIVGSLMTVPNGKQ